MSLILSYAYIHIILYAYDIICIYEAYHIISYKVSSVSYHNISFFFLDFNHHIFYIKIQIFINIFLSFKLHTTKVLSQKKTGFHHILSFFFLSFPLFLRFLLLALLAFTSSSSDSSSDDDSFFLAFCFLRFFLLLRFFSFASSSELLSFDFALLSTSASSSDDFLFSLVSYSSSSDYIHINNTVKIFHRHVRNRFDKKYFFIIIKSIIYDIRVLTLVNVNIPDIPSSLPLSIIGSPL